MFGRKQALHEDLEDTGGFVHLTDKDSPTDRSAKLKTKTEPSRGFFRKGGQYDELKDAASEGTPSPTRSTASDSSRLDIPCLDRDSCSTQQTHKSSGLGTRKSNGFADSILSRFGKEDSAEVGRVKEDKKLHPHTSGGPKQSGGSKQNGTHKKRSSFSNKTKYGYDAVPNTETESTQNGKWMREGETTPPRSVFAQNGGDGTEKYSKRSSPGLISSAAKFLGQGSKRGLGRNSLDPSKPFEDSALENTSDSGSPSHTPPFRQNSQFRPMSDGVEFITTPSKPSRLALNGTPPQKKLFGGSLSPGVTRPLLDPSEASVSPSPCPSPSFFPANLQTPRPGVNPSFHTTSSHQAGQSGQFELKRGSYEYQNRGAQTDPLPHRKSSSQNLEIRSYSNDRDIQHRRSQLLSKTYSESKAHRSCQIGNYGAQGTVLYKKDSIRSLPSEALDIFEPRPDSGGNALEEKLPRHGSKRMTQAIKNVENMTGHEALKALQKGALLRKKWMGNVDIREAPSMNKTERLIRCRLQDGKVVVHYHHKGVKGFLDKDEVLTQVQRVEVVDGAWREGDCLLLHTGRGILALSAPDAATYTTWTLGLNAALTSAHKIAGDILLEAPVHAIPRDSMFVVKESSS